jgi:hypothetical protein
MYRHTGTGTGAGASTMASTEVLLLCSVPIPVPGPVPNKYRIPFWLVVRVRPSAAVYCHWKRGPPHRVRLARLDCSQVHSDAPL